METLAELLPVLMFAALAGGLFLGLPVAFTLAGIALAFAVLGALLGTFRMQQLSLIALRIFGGAMENYTLVAIPMFLVMGVTLERSGIARDLLVCLQILLRRVPGALALAVTFMGTILAATTGIVGASVTMMAVMALGPMLDRGYGPGFASGTIAAAGTLGILIPPSLMLVIMADLLSVPVGTVFVAALVPGLVLAALYAIFVVVAALLKPSIAPPLPPDEGPRGRALVLLVLRSLFAPALLILLVLGSIFAGWATPTEASGIGAAGALILAYLSGALDRRTLGGILESSALMTAMLFALIVGATAFSYVFRALGGEELIIQAIQQIGAGPWTVLIVLMATIFALGFFFDWIEITLIVLPVFAPIVALLDFGSHLADWAAIDRVETIWFLVLAAVCLQASFLTPPFGFSLFFLKGVAPPSLSLGRIYRGIIPFVSLQLLGLGLCITFPSLVLWLPQLLLE